MANKEYHQKYTRGLLTEAVANSISIAGVLRYLQIPWSGGTHAHISRRLKQLGIDWLDNRKENLRFLCPNCHSQTPTFAGRFKNKKRGRSPIGQEAQALDA